MQSTCWKWFALAAVGMFSISAEAGEPPAGIPLWEKGAPGFEARAKEKEVVDEGPGKCNVTNIHNPSITPYLPKDRSSKGKTAILIAPGGGHRMLCMGHEGYGLGEWFAEHGIAAFVLKYRLAREQGSVYTVDDHAMADTRRALRLIRDRSEEWGIHPDRIGVLGFSAGGELAALAAMDWDLGNPTSSDRVEKQACRPAFQALIYPGSSKRFVVTDKVPPAFIALGYKDRDDISIGMAELYLKYKAKGVPAELHVYSNAGHGFGYREGTKAGYGEWPTRLREWLMDSKLMD